MIRTDHVTIVDVSGEHATATLSSGVRFRWRWQDGQWLLAGPA